jgi:hypothetical protein
MTKSKILINKFYPWSIFTQKWAKFFANYNWQICVPTEMVIREPGVVAPKMARIYRTNLYLFDGDVVDYEGLVAAVTAKGMKFAGTSKYQELLMSEVYENCGSDGHIDYQCVGVRFVMTTDAESVLRDSSTVIRGFMLAGAAGYNDSEYDLDYGT